MTFRTCPPVARRQFFEGPQVRTGDLGLAKSRKTRLLVFPTLVRTVGTLFATFLPARTVKSREVQSSELFCQGELLLKLRLVSTESVAAKYPSRERTFTSDCFIAIGG